MDIKADSKRLSFPVGLALAGVLGVAAVGGDAFKNQAGVLSWKLVLVGVGLAVGHVARKFLLDYIDLSEAIKEKTVQSGLLALSVAMIYSATVLALCSGL